MRILFIFIVGLMLAGCARPVGDFGRAQPGYLHDVAMPAIGNLRARMFSEPVSGFNWTDDEVEMHDRAWLYLSAPHTSDWFYNILAEWQRTRLISYQDLRRYEPNYYYYLKTEVYRSSHVRYSRVVRDIQADRAMAPQVFLAICRVREIDRRRQTAAASIPSAGPDQQADVSARHAENELYIDWFVRALRFRYESYNYALEQLLIETPHEEARQVDAELSELAIYVERAERGDFCPDRAVTISPDVKRGHGSRMMSKPFTPEPVFRK